MSNVLDDDRQQVLALGRLGWSLRRIQQATGVWRETASGYLKVAGIPVRERGGRPRVWPPAKPATTGEVSTDPPPAKPATTLEVSTDLPPEFRAPTDLASTRSPTASACEPHRDFIEEALGRGRNAMAIWEDLVDHHGFTARYASVKRFVLKLRGATTLEACAIIVTAPGEDYGDYGDGPMVRHPITGKYRRTRLFVLTLGYSRKSVRLLVWKSSSQVWAELHERAFRCLGGTMRVVVLDNLREGVLKPDIYDPTLNPLYRDVLAHSGAVALPCRVRDPDRKGKVESGVGHAQKTPLKGMRFEALDEAQAYLDRWETNWADTRIHGTTKRQVAAMFAEERAALGPLPIEPFRYYEYGERTVNLDGCIEVEAAYYGAPPGWIGRQVQAQWNDLYVRLVVPATGELLREHVRAPRGYHRIEDRDRTARTPKTTRVLLATAMTAGPSIGATVYALERLRCHLCGALFTAPAPAEVGEEKYGVTTGAMIAQLKYGSGVPFHRPAQLQANIGIPLPASTQWEIVADFAKPIAPVLPELIRQAADGEVLYNDETTMTVLSLLPKRSHDRAEPTPDRARDEADVSPDRTGIFTSGIVATREGHRIALYFTGRRHAGENLAAVLAQRAPGLGPPIQMCDALSRNVPEAFDTILANCLCHARRTVVDVAPQFPTECRYVLETLRDVHAYDATTRGHGLSADARLAFHHQHSRPLMDALHGWCEQQLGEHLVEPNSGLGNAIKYFLKHWTKLTRFLQVAGAPLDSNLVERALKKAILHRKAALFYKTENGAHVGDLFMSVVHTCELNGVNAFEYLVELRRHAQALKETPGAWLPWTYRDTLQKLAASPALG